MHITFERIRWKNFLSTGNQFTEIDLNKHKTVLIIGANGAGKSTLLDALCFVLFNRPFRNINKPQLLNSINQKDLLVELELTIGKKRYKIRRGMKPNIFEIICNGKTLNQGINREFQDVLEKNILKINFKSFTQIFILGASNFTPFMQLTAAARREVIEDLLDLQIFSVMNVLHKNKQQETRNNIIECNHRLDKAREKLKLLQDHKQKIEANRASLIDDNNLKIENAQQQIENIKISIQQNNEERAKLVPSLDLEISVKNQIQTKNNNLLTIVHNINAYTKQLKFFETEEQCPTCKQSIAHDFKCEAIQDINEKTNTLNEQKNALNNEITTLTTELDEIKKIIKEINRLDSEIQQYNNSITLQQNLISNYLSENKKLLEQKQDKSSGKDIAATKTNISLYEKGYEKLLVERNIQEIASVILKDNGIKSKIIKQYIPIINQLINKYLASMDFFVNFEIDENFKEIIKSRHRDEFSYESFSEGEKMRLDLAIMFAWRAIARMRNSTTSNLLLLDEIMDSSLDAAGTDDFLKIIYNLVGDTNVFIISHKVDTIIDKFNEVIRFEKHKNFSVKRVETVD
jgi:DNA repair exonuclease SbcCD ATPase subunit